MLRQGWRAVTGLMIGLLFCIDGVAQEAARPTNLIPQMQTLRQMLGNAALRSAEGQDFKLLRFHTEGAKPFRFLIQGGLHGNEQLASAFVAWLAQRYSRGESPLNRLAPGQIAIDFLPYANPDGAHAHGRYNARGVNLNRNFAVLWGITRENPGATSFSEPETRAIRRLFMHRRYTAAVDVHGYINWIVAPSTPDELHERGVKTTPEQRRRYRQWTEDLRREMALLPGYQFKTAARLGDGGAFEDWAFWSEGTLAYCLELESFQRFVPSYRPDFADLTRIDPEPRIDLFQRYEMFVYRMFENAVRIERGNATTETLAVQ